MNPHLVHSLPLLRATLTANLPRASRYYRYYSTTRNVDKLMEQARQRGGRVAPAKPWFLRDLQDLPRDYLFRIYTFGSHASHSAKIIQIISVD